MSTVRTPGLSKYVKTERILDYVNNDILRSFVGKFLQGNSNAVLLSLGLLFGSRVRIILAQFPLVLCSRVSLYPPSTVGGFLSLSSKVCNSR